MAGGWRGALAKTCLLQCIYRTPIHSEVKSQQRKPLDTAKTSKRKMLTMTDDMCAAPQAWGNNRIGTAINGVHLG